MRHTDIYNYGFGVEWNDVLVTRRDGYYTSVTDYHEHDFYEINLILSGNVKILMKNRFEEGTQNRIVLAPPKTPHYISCKSDVMYSRLYLVFTRSFIENYFPEYDLLFTTFGKDGRIIQITKTETDYFKRLLEEIKEEPYLFGKQLLVYHLLLRISKLSDTNERDKNNAPRYVLQAVSYIENHFHEKITATDIAKKLFIGRTTLMTEFKKHIGATLGNYLTICRLKNAIKFLSDNATIEYTAEKCGFADSSGLIRAFKKHFNTTPYQYIKTKKLQNTPLTY